MQNIKQEPYTLEDLEEHITESHLRSRGGYPYDCQWIGDVFAVASIPQDNESRLDTYTKVELETWLAAANEMRLEAIADGEEEEWDNESIFHETA
jgi:hypothetical protein